LRFTPTAWAKLQCLCHAGETEVGAFGLTSPEDLLLVQDILLVKQETSSVTVRFDDVAVADLFEDLVEQGHRPEEFGRIWAHTHPGSSPQPSSVDEETFDRVFGKCDWAVMFILATSGHTYARLRFGVGPGGMIEIPVRVDYSVPFGPSERDNWLLEYARCVHPVELAPAALGGIWNHFDDLDYLEQQMLLDEMQF
jgi:hypothetical protein